MADKLYFVGLKGFITNKQNQLLILRGSNVMEKEGQWGLPGGRIMEEETTVALTDILKREIKEECGDIDVEIGGVVATWRFHLPHKAIFLVGYECLYHDGEIRLSDENDQYVWIDKSEIGSYEFVDGYKEVITNFFKGKNLLE